MVETSKIFPTAAGRWVGWLGVYYWWGPQHGEGYINCMYSDGQYAKSVIRDSINCIRENVGDMRKEEEDIF